MATVTLRQIKGSPLTNAELDANLTNINAETVDNSTAYRLRPSLDVDLVGSKTVSPLLSFSRGSTGTYYDGKTVAKAEENLFVRSGQFDSGTWGKSSSAVTADALAAPDGSLSAEKLTEIDASTYHIIYQTVASESKSYTFSVYAKAAERGWMTLWYSGSGGFERWSYFDLTNGVVGTKQADVTSSIASVGNGWYRCSITLTAQLYNAPNWIIGTSNADNGNPYFGFLGVVNSGIYIWGAQLEQRSSVTAYTPTTSAPITNYIPQLLTAPTNTPRFDHDPVTGELRGMIVEESRTNLLTYSEDFHVAWSTGASVINSNVAIAPDGTQTADLIVPLATNSSHKIVRTIYPSTSNWTFSVYVKSAGVRYVALNESAQSGSQSAILDLTTGGISGGYGVTNISSVGGGWYRISWNYSTNTSNNGMCIVPLNAVGVNPNVYAWTGDGYSGIYVWGAQFESGSQSTSYISTPLTYTSRNSTATYKGDDGYLKTAAINEARYERNALGGRQLLLEGAATNLFTYSHSFDSSDWSKNNSAVSANAITAPDGTATADLITSSGVDGAVMRPMGVAGTQYTVSVYAKRGNSDWVAMSNAGYFVFFNVQTGVVGTVQNGTATIQNAGNGWFRCTWTPANLSYNDYWRIRCAVADNDVKTTTQTAYFWGAQLETGSVTTSYIPTTSAQVTRAADVYSSSVVTRSADQLSISKTSNWFNSVNGTLALAHDAASGQPLLGDGATTVLSSLGAGTINIDYSNSQLSVVTQSGQTTATQGIFNFDSDLQILGNSTTKANARIKYMKFYPNNVIGSTPEGSGFILDDGYAMLQEDGSVLFQE